MITLFLLFGGLAVLSGIAGICSSVANRYDGLLQSIFMFTVGIIVCYYGFLII